MEVSDSYPSSDIDLYSDIDPYRLLDTEEDRPKSWKKVGSVAFVGSCFMASSFAPAMFKRKRTLNPVSSTITGGGVSAPPLEVSAPPVEISAPSTVVVPKQPTPLPPPPLQAPGLPREPKRQEPVPPLKPKELETAKNIFSNLAKGCLKNPLQLFRLLKDKDKYHEMAKKIEKVHPFSLLIELNVFFRKIFDKALKQIWGEVKEGLIRGFEREGQDLLNHTQDLAKKLGKDQSTLEEHIRGYQWDDLINYLLSDRYQAQTPGS